MPIPTSIEAFGRAFISQVMEEITQERETRPRYFHSRVEEVSAMDSEVFLFTGSKVVAADIIQLDQKSALRRPVDTFRAASTTVPKFKHGMLIDENMIAILNRIANGNPSLREMARFESYVAEKLRMLLEGIKDRQELVYSALFMNTGDYDRLGIMFNGYSWGVQDAGLHPAALAGAARWMTANAATMAAIANIRAWDDYQRINYGGTYDTLMLDETVLNAICISTEYLNLAPAFAAAILGTSIERVSTTVLNSLPYQAKVATLSAILGKKVEVRTPYKMATSIENENGSITASNFWDATYVSLYDSTIFDRSSLDFANVEVIETMPGMVPNLLGEDFAGETEGPVAYATAADPNGDPPGQLLWAVQRGWPRLHKWNKKTAVKVA